MAQPVDYGPPSPRFGEYEDYEANRRNPLFIVLLLALAAGLTTAGYFTARFFTESDGPANEELQPSTASTQQSAVSSSESTTTEDQPATTVDPNRRPKLIQIPDGTYVSGILDLDVGPNEGLFVLSGRVPDEATAEAIRQAADRSYAPYFTDELVIDPSLEPAPWLAAAPNVIGVLPTITDGQVMLADQTVKLSVRAPSELHIQYLGGVIPQLTGGLPVEFVDQVVTNLEPPLFSVEYDAGVLTMDGFLPDQQIIDMLEQGAHTIHGPENVVNNLTVQPGTYTAFWMFTSEAVFNQLQVLPWYRIDIVNGIISGGMRADATFAFDSADVSENFQQVLDVAVSVVGRDATMGLKIVGHTDSTGDPEYNKFLSLERAQSVADYVIAQGIPAEKVIVIGAGDTDPFTSNDTAEGRAMNRRITFEFGLLDQLAQG